MIKPLVYSHEPGTCDLIMAELLVFVSVGSLLPPAEYLSGRRMNGHEPDHYHWTGSTCHDAAHRL
jgi:hypothetical protein